MLNAIWATCLPLFCYYFLGKGYLLMKPSVGTHLVGWFLSSNRDTNNQWETFCSVVRWPIASFHQRGILTWFWAQSWILETVPFCGNEQLIPQESLIWSQIGTKGIWLSAQANHCSTAQKLLDDITEMLDSKQLFFVIHSLSGKIFLRVIRIPKFLWSLIGFCTGSMSPCLDSF